LAEAHIGVGAILFDSKRCNESAHDIADAEMRESETGGKASASVQAAYTENLS
jgi:hypothetical protein